MALSCDSSQRKERCNRSPRELCIANRIVLGLSKAEEAVTRVDTRHCGGDNILLAGRGGWGLVVASWAM